MEGYTGRGVKTGGIIGAALLALLLAGPTGCATTRAVGDAVDKIVTGDESALTRAKRGLVIAYAAQRDAARTARRLYRLDVIDREQATAALEGLTKSKAALDSARTLIAVGDLVKGRGELEQAETIIAAILIALPED